MVARILLLLCLALLGAEVFARFYLKWGDPALYVAHPRIEYMLAPDQDVSPYGNRQLINHYGMRSGPWPEDPSVRRYLVMGDSVLNGGLATDHAELATTMLSTGGKFYGNISANSWGPENMAAWLEKYGSFNASGVIVLINSHDASDIAGFSKLDLIGQPSSRPWLAIEELIPKIVSRLPLASPANAANGNLSPSRARIAIGKAGLVALLDELERIKVPVCLIQHQTVPELKGSPDDGWQINRDAFAARGWPSVQLSKWTGPVLEKDPAIFQDHIHLAPSGQALIAEAIKECTGLIDSRSG